MLTYPHAVAILEPSWNWPYSIKDMQVFGRTASVITVLRDRVIVHREAQDNTEQEAPKLAAPVDDPLRYFASVVRGETDERGSLSALDTNLVVAEILDAARQSAHAGKTVTLPLNGQ